ncbi:MAG: response regulator, partial [Alphaproteobacteria bacterium]
MTRSSHIVVVDDDPRVRDLLCRYLSEEGFRVSAAENGDALRRHMAGSRVDLVILDLVMPGEDGLTLARELRATSGVPIIMVTGKGDVVDRVVGLEMGADDYIAKPFHLREVLARVRTVLRRTAERVDARSGERAEVGGDDVVRFSGWRLDLIGRELRDPDDVAVPLTTSEFNLLRAFVQRPNRPLDRDQLMDLLHDRDWTPFDRSIDTLVGRLRKKIEKDQRKPEIIKTVRGVGYVFAARVEL